MNQTITQAGATVPDGGAFKVANISGGEHRMELSRQWASRPHDQRYLNLADLESATRQRYEESKQAVIRNREIEFLAPDNPTSFDEARRLTFGLPDGTEANATNWSFGQTARLAGAPAGYLQTLPGFVVADALTWGMRQNRDIEDIKAYYRPGKDAVLHANTGPDYGRIPDFEVVRAVRQVAGNGTGDERWKVPGVMNWSNRVYDPNAPITKDTTTLFASDRDVFMFLVDDRNPVQVGTVNGEPDYMFRGFYLKNSEMGASSLVLGAMYLRAICCNRILWGVEQFEEISMRHSKYAPDRFIESAMPALRSYAEGSTARLSEGVEKAKQAQIAHDDEKALEWLQGRSLSRKRAAQVLETVEREEGHKARSVWDMAQGITAVARTIPHQDQRVDLERVAGRMLDKVAA